MKKEDKKMTEPQEDVQEVPRPGTGNAASVERSIEVVEFDLAGGRYAIDINIVREIVEMVPITPIPRAPRYITGVINLRGEITNIVNLNMHLNLPDLPITKAQKIIVFTADTVKGNNVGIVVDSVSSVTTVTPPQIKPSAAPAEGGKPRYVKGIISLSSAESAEREDRLVIWLDILKLFKAIEAK